MIKRDLYINQLNDLVNTKTLKILTGVHGCGKSCILLSFADSLKDEKNNVIYLDFNSLKNRNYTSYLKLYDFLSERIMDNKMNYIIFDNIRKVENWYEVINSLSVDYNNIDFFISGLSENLEDSELSKHLSWPIIEVNILPLSFKEYLKFNDEYWDDDLDINGKFKDYLHFGGFPVIFEHKKSDLIFNNIIEGIYNTIIFKDLISNYKIKNPLLLNEIFYFTINNLGEYLSSKKISEYFITEGVKTTPTTVLEYLKYFDKSYLFYSVKRFNLKCDVYLRTLEKHYVCDLGLRNFILGFDDEYSNGVLENLVYFELLRRNYKVSTVKYNAHKVDFMAKSVDKTIYIQILKNLDDDLLNMKLDDLNSIKDNYEKMIISFDKTHIKNIHGIKIVNIIDFLLEEDNLIA
ncbi:hypothetical protein BGI41_05195 [Methanobrevibacter sp. 87.7]|uniref:ATP-binding protein n=1 Tax=Methanobrevibacter sp. 87.7 TaxID=387957 RepID=UPI000B5037BC|nr:ATP-binding protein [Methanobrevibacter sp. 87.7]OWT32899.1 hypothetical protein BGI41_05195 [Methanobrevibacter sp. 87.7]